MFKMIIATTAFIGAISVGVQPAAASSMVCNTKYMEAMVACQNSPFVANCQMAAEAAYVQCLQDLYDGRDPIGDG